MPVFCLCVYSFVICWSPLAVFGADFALLGRLWAEFLWDPLGHLGLPRGSPWRHFGFPLAPLGRCGTIWGTLGSQGELGMTLGPKRTFFSEQIGPQVARLRIKSDHAELSGVCELSDVCARLAQSGAGATAPNPTLLAPGARMTVV